MESAPTDGTDQTETINSEKSEESELEKKKPFNPWLTTLITLIVFVLLLIGAYFFLRYKIIHWTDSMRQTIEQRVTPKEDNTDAGGETAPTDLTDSTDETPTDLTDQTDNNGESAPTENTEKTETEGESARTHGTKKTDVKGSDKPAAKKKINYFDDNERVFTEMKATETVGKDSRLAWVAYKYYGNKAYWVFVYEANRDKIESPDFVMPGLELQIPRLPKELRNPNDPKTAELLERLSKKYLSTF